MKRILISILNITAVLVLLTVSGCSKGRNSGTEGNNTETPSKSEDFSFVPNQLLANSWYRPGGSYINGHLDESFGNKELWPELMTNLKESGGAFSIFAAEVGHLSTKTGILPLLKAEGIPISVEMPGFTQCIDGPDLGNAELNGKAVNGQNIFSTVFGITNPSDRTDPDGKGWFVTKDRQDFIPDEILFDERQPNLCPEFDENTLINTQGTWEVRKKAARRTNCNLVASLEFDDLLASLRQDYIDFLRIAKEKWGDNMPDITIHWNVNPGWEWRDENAMDAIYASDPDFFSNNQYRYRMVFERPQYNSVEYCNMLVDALTEAGFKPARILMDVDWTYCIPYIKEVLIRHKKALGERGVQMGINIVEASIADNEALAYRNGTLVRQASGGSVNQLYENTLVAITEFLIDSGIYEKGMQLRVGSWSHRPYEQGAEVDENTSGSMAHTANRIYEMMRQAE